MDITNIIEPEIICLELQADSKQAVFEELVELLDRAGKLSNKSEFLDDIWKREAIGNTGFDDGIAIPHAKSTAVAKPAVAVGISRTGIDYDADGGELSDVFFMLASPDNNDDHHIEVLAQISTKLIEDGFVTKLKAAESVEKAQELFLEVNSDSFDSYASSHHEVYVEPLSPWAQSLNRLKEHLLYGTSHMIPFVVAGGVLLSLSVMISGHGAVPESGVLADIAQMGIAGLTLFTAVLGGYIAYSMADKPGLAPGMIGSWVAVNQYNTGFLGAIVVGFFAGFVVNLLKKIKLPDSMISLSSIFIYPLVGTFVTCGAVMWVIGSPIAQVMLEMNQMLTGMAGSGKMVLGSILGAMTAFDMGGPINKVATLFAQTQVNTQPWLMGGVGIAICTPPLGMALATFISPKKFKRDEREAGKAAGIMGMIGISEGAIPFAAADPARVLPAVVAGGIVGNVVGFMFHVVNHAPWGGWIVLPVVDGKIGYIIGTLAGALTTALIVILLKKNVVEGEASANQFVGGSVTEEGQADVLAITSCPSGVAHTFLAAKSLEKAAHHLGVRIKVETQGANGIGNRITPKDIERARLVIFAHDVAIKEVERFANVKTLDVSTKEAMLNAQALIMRKV
ncbi:fructose-like PTS system EIIC or EIIBC or EIIABC component [Vibrio crassostreae]|uniref:fructose-specific PTS transporter subunit EIIC n=1 Tax=Vibrio crassostreae TaxID=246167 RepID=UPI001B314507|nr:fructose-specific PTS transporter subunit EIIC [Vibrio crassostreae]CAK1698472.1 fructose-like PTS system EIIC or EIIBC or EIIABC component [Vibrio crassostreae]CAK1698745.1 fructose-like PTS system EIIC or EIIBC or EIIABC component [Vibrio crassostreae]CAK1716532.1 fructose-like PTS system EIIC or EIIBC or EIIABC component [Vibrio crassostreae]CAK1716910.1 fructose-like PTS system EIIC or EIIBC or EIIABC component [Vibrio crassostreae]CAK1735358.1 fructose-like PTS system EIIC or EIIBC or 